MIAKLLKHVKQYTLPSVLAPLFVAVEVVLEVFIPFTMAKIIDVGVIELGGDVNYILTQGGIMLLLAACSLLCGAAAGIFAAKAGVGFTKNLRLAVFEKIQKFSFANVDKFSTASLITRQTTDINNVQNAYTMCLRMLFRAPLMLVGATVMAFRMNAVLSIVFAVAIPVIGVLMAIVGKLCFPRFKKMFERYDDMNASVQENLIGIRIVKAFVREDYEIEKYKKSSDGLRAAQFNAEFLLVLGQPVLSLIIFTCTVAVIAIGGVMSVNGTMGVGELSSFISYVTQALMSTLMLMMVFMMIVISKESAERIVEILDEEITVSDENADKELKVADGSIEFDNVDFGYKSKDVLALENVNLKIAAGETVGIIGGTGAAKSTLVQLIPRLYDVTDGSVKVGGRDVRDYTLKELRESVAMVLQKNVLFSGTIKENLKWGNENATDEEIVEAAKRAAAHDFVASFPAGYETELGQGGVNVSGGQKQRLCIARALLKKPKIMILDDSTSAVDTATDKQIRDSLANLRDMTVIIIAQRISSVMNADKIIVMDDGRVDAVGTHDELMASNAIYREVYESQQKGVEE